MSRSAPYSPRTMKRAGGRSSAARLLTTSTPLVTICAAGCDPGVVVHLVNGGQQRQFVPIGERGDRTRQIERNSQSAQLDTLLIENRCAAIADQSAWDAQLVDHLQRRIALAN